MKKIFITALFTCLTLVMMAQDRQWSKALRKNSIEHYQKFIDKYPRSAYTEKAQGKIIEIKFNQAMQNNTIESYKDFLTDCPAVNEYCKKGEELLVELEYKLAKEKHTIDSYQYFLKNYGENKYREEVLVLQPPKRSDIITNNFL